jgi:AcrR family transcriptional regulator
MSQLVALAPRKQPRQGRAKATRDAIIEAAAQIVARDGLAGFNTNAVAERAGVSIGSLYQYFPNKDAVMAALIRHQIGRQLATFQDAIEATANSDIPQTIRALVRAAMAHHHDDAVFATAIDHEEARLPIARDLDGFLETAGHALVAVLQRHKHQLGDLCWASAATTLPYLVRAIVDVWANQSPPQLQKAEDEAVRAVLGYLKISHHSINPLLSIESY